FQVGIAQKLAQLPLLSGAAFRLVFLACAVAIWIWGTIRFARVTRVPVEREPAPGAPVGSTNLGTRLGLVLAIVLGSYGFFIYGVMQLGWDFDQMSALFFSMGIAAGLIGGLGVEGTAVAFVDGFASMAFAAMIIGFSRGIYVVL